jgi:porphobilinogen synthase
MSILGRRPRRGRANELVREMLAETRWSAASLIQPYFVTDQPGVKYEIPGMPGIFRESPDEFLAGLEADIALGIRRIMLFGVTGRKSDTADAAYAADNPVITVTREIRRRYGDDLLVFADVCLCAYTEHGHCGLVVDGTIDNDQTLPVLSRMAVALADAGVQWVAPSDMMDGRVGAIRRALDDAGHTDVGILAYAAKYASAYYGPFREAAESAPQFGDRRTYQMDYRNRREARLELELDELEDADWVMVKPALPYLDIIADFRRATSLPVAAYNVSGEYAAAKLLVKSGYADERSLVLENLTAIFRAGAQVVLTYHLRDLMRHGWR